jgi:Glycine rich protein
LIKFRPKPSKWKCFLENAHHSSILLGFVYPTRSHSLFMRNLFQLKFCVLLLLLLGGARVLQAQTIVCAGAPVSLTLNTHRGFVQWQSSTDGGATWTSIVGANSDTTVVTPTDTTWYRAAITEGTCNPVYSDTSYIIPCHLIVNAGPDKTYCASPVTLGGSPIASGCSAPYTYNWSPATGLNSTVVPYPTAAPSAPTSYVLTVVDAMGCVAMDTVLVDTGSGSPGSDSTVFAFTGGVATFVVPGCVDSVIIKAWGAQGENALVGGATGGLGGYAYGKLDVTPGETLTVYVGGQAGYNGGGQGGINGNDVFSGPSIGTYGGRGGGASDVRQAGTALTNRVIVGGGGGGAGHNGVWPGCQTAGPGGNGGVGGATVGGTGGTGVGTPCNCQGGGGAGGAGGSQTIGGLYGSYGGNTACLRPNWAAGTSGVLGIGGAGSLIYYNGTGGGGGGGGGYYGGGSGGNGSDTTPGGGGGGGSNFTTGLSGATSTAGVRTGNGRVVILY